MTAAPFLSLDGIDGTGKSTQCRLLVEWLSRAGVPVVACRDPGGTVVGDQLRQIVLDSRADLTTRTEALLFMASRAELVARVIRPALDAGRLVVCDRFVTANVAYQGHAGGLPADDLWTIGRFATGDLFPDLTIVLDLPVEQAAARRGRAADRLEGRGAGYLGNVRQGFLAEAARQPDRFAVLDAGPGVEAVHRQVREVVGPFLRRRGVSVRDDA
jgi:dTMP kinase